MNHAWSCGRFPMACLLGIAPGCWWIPDPVAIDDSSGNESGVYSGLDSGLDSGTEIPTFAGPLDIIFVAVPAGSFDMGNPSWDSDMAYEGEVLHRVALSHDIWVSQYEITQAEWQSAMGTTPWEGHTECIDPSCPASFLTWADAARFANELSAIASLDTCYKADGSDVAVNPYTCAGYRLPTEAEWEYTARAGTGQEFLYAGSNDINAVGYAEGWDNAQPVGQRAHNAWGTHDMTGNLWEWTNDAFGDYDVEATTDPTGPAGTDYRVTRGGAAGATADNCRVAKRLSYEAANSSPKSVGFRIARSLN